MNCEKEFYDWLLLNTNSQQGAEIIRTLKNVSDYCIAYRFLKVSIFETSNADSFDVLRQKILSDKIFIYNNKKNINEIEKATLLYSKFLKNLLVKTNCSSDYGSLDKEDKFIDWLRDNNLSERTIVNYINAVRRMNSTYFDRSKYSSYFDFVDKILKDKEFISINNSCHHIYSCALKKYVEFLNNGDSNSKFNLINKNNNIKTENESLFKVDFWGIKKDKLTEYAFSVPIYFYFMGIKKNVESWLDVIAEICNILIDKGYKIDQKFSFIKKIRYEYDRDHYGTRLIKNGYYIQIPYVTGVILKSILKIFKELHINFNECKIYYKDKFNKTKKTYNENSTDYQNKETEYEALPNVYEENIAYDDYEKILNEYFSEGYLFDNLLQKRKFIRIYNECYNLSEFKDTDEIYLKKIAKAGFQYENKIYPFTIISEGIKKEIENYLLANLNSKSPVLYYEKIFQLFSRELNTLFDAGMFKIYLTRIFEGQFDFKDDYIAVKNVEINVKQYLIDVFMNNGCALDKEQIYASLPNIAESAIDSLLTDSDFVLNFRGKSYFYKDVFMIDDKEISEIENFISNKIIEQDHLSGLELCDYIKKHLPNIIEYNPTITELGIRNVIKLYLRDKFSFNGDVISAIGETLDVKALYDDFCKQRESFTYQDLEEFRDQIHKSYIDYDIVFQNMIRVNKDLFIRKDKVVFDVEKIDNAILKYFVGDYISFCDIINYTEFPSIQYHWNEFVLESYLFSVSKTFKLLHKSFNSDAPVGGIVRKDSNLFEFDDLLIQILRDKKLYNEDEAFAYLQENQYIFTKKIKNIEFLINKAKQEV